MSKLDTALRAVLDNRHAQGGSMSAAAIERVNAVQKSLGRIGIVVFCATLIVFGITVYATIAYIHDPATLGAITGAIGLSLGAALEVLRRVWKDWGEANLLLILLTEAREDQVAAMLEKLIGKI